MVNYDDPGDSPFLTIITRHWMTPDRAEMMSANRLSVAAQTCHDYEVITILDKEGRGRRWAASSLVPHSERIRGEYVMCLDDDDMLIVDDFVCSLQAQAIDNEYPGLIVWRMADARGERFTSPRANSWEARPVIGSIGQSFAVKREWFLQYAHKQAEPEDRVGDGVFLQAVWDAGARFYWWDRIVAKRNAIGALNK